jgi:hypothetical protein
MLDDWGLRDVHGSGSEEAGSSVVYAPAPAVLSGYGGGADQGNHPLGPDRCAAPAQWFTGRGTLGAMKKLLILVVLVALAVVAAKKVRTV